MKIKVVRRAIPEDSAPLSPDLHPLLDQIYRTRDVKSCNELDYSLNRLHRFGLLSGIDQAVNLLKSNLDHHSKIVVVGDFDADGATSTALTVRALKMLGFENVDYLVPNRFEFGYGLTPEIVAVAADMNPQLIITVDNGISSSEGVNAANSRGIDVLITDHHLPASDLPNAQAIVNPNLHEDPFPSKNLSGVGTIFYVMLALRAHLRQNDHFKDTGISEPNMAEFLDLVALGTVADVVPLDFNNRILITHGLARIRTGNCCAGIRALATISGRTLQSMTASDLAFALGPRLNAAGRIEDMSIGIECLLSDDEDKAQQLAVRLEELNNERKAIESDMKQQALKIVDDMQLNNEREFPVGICLYDPEWHQGVIGILASRIKDKLHRPVIAFANANIDGSGPQQLVKGSARSIPGIHIRDVLDAVATSYPQILTKFGGHAMAAGMTIKKQDLEVFAKVFNSEVDKRIDHDLLCNVIYSDGDLGEKELCLETADRLRHAGPWGQHFPEPLFDGDFEVLDYRVVGERHIKCFLKHCGKTTRVNGILFNAADLRLLEGKRKIKIVYQLDINEYNGFRSVQLIIRHVISVQ